MKKSPKQLIAKERMQIDRADAQLLAALARRFRAVERIGQIKKAYDLPMVQKSRWSQVLKSRFTLSRKLNLSRNLSAKVFELIRKESHRIQREVGKSALKMQAAGKKNQSGRKK
jgi:chorismate mutase